MNVLWLRLTPRRRAYRFAEGNRLSRVAGLDGCRQLEQLHLGGQRLPPGEALAFDPVSLQALAPTLRVLDVAACNLRETEQLGELHALEELQMARNPVEDLTVRGQAAPARAPSRGPLAARVRASAYQAAPVQEVAVMLRGQPRLRSLDMQECPVMRGRKNREKIIMLTERLSA